MNGAKEKAHGPGPPSPGSPWGAAKQKARGAGALSQAVTVERGDAEGMRGAGAPPAVAVGAQWKA